VIYIAPVSEENHGALGMGAIIIIITSNCLAVRLASTARRTVYA